jgi:hypothetical protein
VTCGIERCRGRCMLDTVRARLRLVTRGEREVVEQTIHHDAVLCAE